MFVLSAVDDEGFTIKPMRVNATTKEQAILKIAQDDKLFKKIFDDCGNGNVFGYDKMKEYDSVAEKGNLSIKFKVKIIKKLLRDSFIDGDSCSAFNLNEI